MTSLSLTAFSEGESNLLAWRYWPVIRENIGLSSSSSESCSCTPSVIVDQLYGADHIIGLYTYLFRENFQVQACQSRVHISQSIVDQSAMQFQARKV